MAQRDLNQFFKGGRPPKDPPTNQNPLEEEPVNPHGTIHSHAKRNSLFGFNKDTIKSRIDAMSRLPPQGNWRQFGELKIEITVLEQSWRYTPEGDENMKEYKVSMLCPWGMIHTMTKKQSSKKCYSSFNVLPEAVRSALGVTKETYNKEKMKVEVSNRGNLGLKSFNRIFCSICEFEVVPQLIEKYVKSNKLRKEATIADLIDNFDKIGMTADTSDVVGCFIPLEESVMAGPNGRRFIIRPTEHVSTCHPQTSNKLKQLKKPMFAKALPTGSKPKNDVVIVSEARKRSAGTDNATLVTKYNKKLKFANVGALLGQTKINLAEKCADATDEFAKGLCIKIVHGGVNMKHPHTNIMESYELATDAISSYHELLTKNKDVRVTVNERVTAAPPPKVTVNLNNISRVEKAILSAYKEDPKSPYQCLAKSTHWSFIHDGISKFSTSFNGFSVKYLDGDFSPCLLPVSLTKCPGAFSSEDLVEVLMKEIAQVKLLNAADCGFNQVHDVLSGVVDRAELQPCPQYFKMTKLEHLDNDEKTIKLIAVMPSIPVGNCGDGVSTNLKAGRIISEEMGWPIPSNRCSSHSCDGTLKRIATSKTMNVAEVVSCYEALRAVIQHFKQSIKDKDVLEESMKILNMTPVRLWTWGGTRMGHFLTACQKTYKNLIPVYNALYSISLKETKHRDTIFSPKICYTLALMSDLSERWMKEYLRPLDKNNTMVSTVERTSNNLILALKEETLLTNADSFLENLSIDVNGNMMLKIGDDDIILNRNSKIPRGHSRDSFLQEIKETLKGLKTKIMNNLSENIADQISDSMYSLWSCLDLLNTESLEERLVKLYELFTIFGTRRVQTMPETWMSYDIVIEFPSRIECKTWDEFKAQFTKSWPVITTLWLQERKNGKKSQVECWKNFITSQSICFPDVSELIQILLATAANTGYLERSYSILEMICDKRRNSMSIDTIQTLYLLGVLQIPVKGINEYSDVIKILEQ